MSAKDLLLDAVAYDGLTPVDMPFLPALDKKVFVRVLNAGERHLYAITALSARTEGQVISDYEIAAMSACEADGTPMFHKRDASGRISIDGESINKLRLVDGRAIHAIALKAVEVSGLDIDAKADAKKNSSSTRSDESSSGLPSDSDVPSTS